MPDPVWSSPPVTSAAEPWDERRDANWAEDVLTAANGKWRREDAGKVNERLELDVECPRCHHPGTSGVIYFRSGVKTFGEDQPPTIAPVFCQCGFDHGGRPLNRRGCGVWGDVRVVTT